MSKYAIFIDDCEVHLDVKVGDRESIDTIRELIGYEMKSGIDQGYVESYPFFQCDWEIVGFALPVGTDKTAILEIAQ